jgi:AcrR family transcriptional regulator
MATRVDTPTRMTASERREQLLDVTKAIVAERGFHAVSIEAVAREAGITRPIVYGHFADLPGLLRALVEREGERALAQLAEFLPRDLASGDPREDLLAGLRGYLQAAGCVVSPRQPGEAELPRFAGGFTVQRYGSSHADGLDAMQLEIAAQLRDDDHRPALIEVLAYAFGNLVSRYADTHTLSAAVTSRGTASNG